MNVQPTVEVINGISDRLREAAGSMDHIARAIVNTEDLTLVSEVLNEITNMNGNLRLDLLVTRPIREYQREVK
jgi:hypothetical protein